MAVQTPAGQNGLPVAKELTDPRWAWGAYDPDGKRPWNLARAGHLYRRAAFGANWTQLQQALSDGPQRSVDKLIRPEADVAAFNQLYDDHETASGGSLDGLRAWWLRRMIQTPHPLLEKMTLFWHSHFATNGAEVKDARLMRTHVQLLRTCALESFRPLLDGVSRDPAMLTSLGADANRKAVPNDHFVRPLMEVFTVGAGRYTPEDVREAARACTGWFVLRGRLRYIPREHDAGVKRVLGQEGDFADQDVMRILLEQRATAETVVRRLYRWLISEANPPAPELIAPLVDAFAKDYDVSAVVETMLRSNLFFSPVAYRRRVKSPVEYALGIIRGLEGMVSTTQLAQDLAGLGQNLYCPPTVKGWLGGRHWINSATLVRRHTLSLHLLRGEGPYSNKLNPWQAAEKHGCSELASAAQFVLDLFLQGDLGPDVSEALRKMIPTADIAGNAEAAARRFAHAVTTQPEFYLA
ncbi:MAG: DUF1800 domain-containing protein [Sedimentisphaerales bacterium]|nr:DUF1800 domain-containing protein [Sedimentisphaerales bacterium]